MFKFQKTKIPFHMKANNYYIKYRNVFLKDLVSYKISY